MQRLHNLPQKPPTYRSGILSGTLTGVYLDEEEDEDRTPDGPPFRCPSCERDDGWHYSRTCYHNMTYFIDEYGDVSQQECDMLHDPDGEVQEILCQHCGHSMRDEMVDALPRGLG